LFLCDHRSGRYAVSVTRSSDERVFVHAVVNFTQIVSTEVPRPTGVGSWRGMAMGQRRLLLLTDLPDGRFRVQFRSDRSRRYVIQYTDDLLAWTTAHGVILGTGHTVEWIDNGPPATDPHPATVHTRFYRVGFAP
jgi:hypothetical protein